LVAVVASAANEVLVNIQTMFETPVCVAVSSMQCTFRTHLEPTSKISDWCLFHISAHIVLYYPKGRLMLRETLKPLK